MAERLEGRVGVITGGGSGIGYATALRFAQEGAKVVIVDTNPESGEKVAKEVGGIFVKADVTNADDVARMYKTAFDTYGRIDIAFNNAGISPPDDDSILTTGIDAWERVQRVNLTSVYLCCKEVLPYSILRCDNGICYITDFLYSIKRWSTCYESRTRCSVCSPGCSCECSISWTSQHSPITRTLCKR